MERSCLYGFFAKMPIGGMANFSIKFDQNNVLAGQMQEG